MSRIKEGKKSLAVSCAPPPQAADVLWEIPPAPEEQLHAFGAALNTNTVELSLLFPLPDLKPGEEVELGALAYALPTGFVPAEVPKDQYYWLMVAGEQAVETDSATFDAELQPRIRILLEAAQAVGLRIPAQLIFGAGYVEYREGQICAMSLRFALAAPNRRLTWFQVGPELPNAPQLDNTPPCSYLRLQVSGPKRVLCDWDFRQNARVASELREEAERLLRQNEAEREALKREREELERDKKAVTLYSSFPATALELLRNTPTEIKARLSRTTGYGNQFAIFENPDDQKIALRLLDEIEKGNKQAWYLQTVPTRDEALALISVVALAGRDMKPHTLTDAASGVDVPGFLVPFDQSRLMEGMGFERQLKPDGRQRFQDKEKRRLEKALSGLEDKKTHIVQAYTARNEQGKTVRRFVKTSQPVSLVRQIELAEIDPDAKKRSTPRAADYSKFLFLPAELFINPRYAQIPRDLGMRIKQIETGHNISRREHTPVFLLGLYDAMQPRMEIHLDTLMTRLSISKSDLKKRGLPYVKAMIEDSCRVAQELGVLKAFRWQAAEDGGIELLLELDPERVPSMRLPTGESPAEPKAPARKTGPRKRA